MTTRLWQRNLIGTGVAAVTLTAITWFTLLPAWRDYERTVRPAHVAAAHQPIEVDGLTWSVRNVSRSTTQLGSGAPVPEGTVRMNVAVQRSGSPADGIPCTGYLVDGDRSWRAVAGAPCGAATAMEWSFLIPASAEPTAVDVRKSDGSILIRLRL
ncbi:hypothetical protein HZU40_22765 [Mycolicibacterium fluoranthenivorans]|jgi:hypothetical protein|uniref:Uncharacterized protein n=1 Tax=Mycolicibacterium fluoranthenivorans TaxID=258505 RepID=A0A1G4X0N3_9MYCO|nr:hypothetical protein [Mycolicibacterium fluoranthenivorans]QNJ91033.1 hypothetical protein HZU40_22765 [Mycolicibacterium fluoranthenivorans]SCX33485.1 hypothetical protein SAMN02799620_05955 [Mycolicibacterium fluoranthenivorans]